MKNTDRTKTAMERSIQAVTKRPAIGQLTEFLQIDVASDGCCSIKDGDATMTIDMPKEFGGGGATHSAGFYARAALGACLAQGYYVWAAVLGVPIDHLSIDIHADSDSRGVLGIDDSVARSYSGLRYVVNIDSPAPRARIEEVLDKSDDLDWVRDVFVRAIPLEREIRVTQSAAAE